MTHGSPRHARKRPLRSPRRAAALFKRGAILEGRGQIRAATSAYSEAIQVDGRYAAAHIALGRLHAAAGRLHPAVASLTTAANLAPRDHDARYNLGVVHLYRRDFAQAKTELRAAIDTRPTSARAHNNLGIALDGLGQADQSIQHFSKAVTLNANRANDPSSANATFNLALAYLHSGRVNEAEQQFQSALVHDPRLVEAQFHLGEILYQRGHIDRAFALFESALARY